MNRSYYSDTIENFNVTKPEEIIGQMAILSKFADELVRKVLGEKRLESYKVFFQNIEVEFILNILYLEWVKELM